MFLKIFWFNVCLNQNLEKYFHVSDCEVTPARDLALNVH